MPTLTEGGDMLIFVVLTILFLCKKSNLSTFYIFWGLTQEKIIINIVTEETPKKMLKFILLK